MGKLAPWAVWGRCEDLATEGTDDHQVAHVDFGSIEYEYKNSGGDEVIKRKFVVQEVVDDADVLVVIRASETAPRARPWEFTFRYQPKLGSGVFHWVLAHKGTGSVIRTQLPMKEKHWILTFGMWPVIGSSVVWVCLLGFLLYYWYYYS